MKTGNWIAVLLFLFLSTAIWTMTAGFPPSDDPNIPGAAFFPRLIAMIIAGLTVLMAIENVRTNDKSKLFDWTNPGLKRNFLLLIVSSVYCYLLGNIGFLILTPICLMIMMLIMELKGRLGWKLFSSVAATVAIYLVFEVFLDVPLPTWSF